MKKLSETALRSRGFGAELRRRGFMPTKITVAGRQYRGWSGLRVLE
jgi:hypothetical protein